MQTDIFRILSDNLVQSTSKQGRSAFMAYQQGFRKQSEGEYAAALKSYRNALRVELDPFARSYIYYNIGIIYVNLGKMSKALLSFNQSLRLNPFNSSPLNNVGVIYYDIAQHFSSQCNVAQSEIFTERANNYWLEATRLAPSQYLDVENWLRNSNSTR